MIKTCLMLLSAVSLLSINYVLAEDEAQAICRKWDTEFKEGQKITVPGRCLQATCIKAKSNEIETRECPVYKIRSECSLTDEDLTKEYPECCRQVVCPPVLH